MLKELLAYRGADAAGVEAKPIAVMFLKLIHLAREDPSFETVDRAVLPVNLIQAFVADGGFKFIERQIGAAQRMAEGFGQLNEFTQNCRQLGQRARLPAQFR